MNNGNLLGYYFPTTVLFIDDNRKFLKNICAEISTMQIACKSCDSPFKALGYLDNMYKPNHFIEKYLTHTENTFLDHHEVSLKIHAVYQEIYNPERFNEISVIVIDHAMPGMNGLELCQKIKEKYPAIKIIFLTGEADEKIAVSGFNRGIIDKFIRKDEQAFLDVLSKSIQELQIAYFQTSSKAIIDAFTHSQDKDLTCFKDKIFIDFFNNLLKKEKVAEFYLLEGSGSYLFLDSQANPSLLIVKSDDEMKAFYELAENADAPSAIITKLKNKEVVPYFHTESDFEITPAQWAKYLHPAKTLLGQQSYYYSYISDVEMYGIKRIRILSYEAFSSK